MANANFQGVAPAGYIAGAAISQYRLVKLDSTQGQVVVTSAITDVGVGASLQSAAAAGETIPVQTYGKVKLTASDAISIGAQVMPTASGSGKVVTAAGATAKSIGVALEASGADGDIIEVLLSAPNVNGPANS